MKNLSTKKLVLGGVLAALTLAMTYFSVPLPLGYAHAGDGVIYLSAMLLGPFAVFPAAIGSALSDLLLGYVIYVPATLVIKGAMGYLSGRFLKKGGLNVRNALVFCLCSLMMAAGYFLYETVLYGAGAALASAPGNLLQAAVGAGLGCVLLPLRARLSERLAKD